MVEKGLGRESDEVIVGVTAEGLKRFIVMEYISDKEIPVKQEEEHLLDRDTDVQEHKLGMMKMERFSCKYGTKKEKC